MISRSAILWLLGFTGLTAMPDNLDILRFTNGDQLHGSFQGIKDGTQVIWRRDDLSEAAELKTTQLRSIVLRAGRPLKGLASLSNAVLVNGDRIPGAITAIDDEAVTLNTTYAGTMRVPRRQVVMLCPNPLGGRIYYQGPFREDEWKMVHPSFLDGLPAAKPGERDADDQPGRWVFSGSAWYWSSKRLGTALIHESGMSDRSVLAFDIAWKNQLCLTVSFFADFARPKPLDDEKKNGDKEGGGQFRSISPGDFSQLPRIFGNSYVLQLYSNYIMLNRTQVDEKGNPSWHRIQLNNNNVHLSDRNQARIELRVNRLTGSIALFIDGEFTSQWNDNEAVAGVDGKPATLGAGFGYMAQGADSPVRVSDVIVSEWNGMPDSARSLQVDKQDIILMSNGTDRFAGRMGKLDDMGMVLFKGKHGDLQVPLDEIAEIRFASEGLAPAVEGAAENLSIRLSPIGTITGRPISGDASTLEIDSAILGKLKVSMDSAVFLDFNTSKLKIDEWYGEF